VVRMSGFVLRLCALLPRDRTFTLVAIKLSKGSRETG
jgi:hypothetical protein